MDRPISIDEAGERFSDIMRDVGEGETYVLTRGGKPVAKITPVPTDPSPEELAKRAAAARRLAAELDKRPVIVTGPWTRDELYER